MKPRLHLRILACIPAVAILATGIGSGVEAAGSRASLRIAGRVPVNHGLQLTPSPGAENLQFLESPSWVEIANVSETGNSPNGYKVLVETENGERLVGNATGTSMPYRLRYGAAGGESDVTFSGASGTAARRSRPAERGTTESRLLLEVPAKDHPADEYSDTIVLTIVAN